MKLTHLLTTFICIVTAFCSAADAKIDYTGFPVRDFKQYIETNSDKVKSLADIKTWMAEYKKACPTAKITEWSLVASAQLLCSTNKTIFNETIAELDNLAKTYKNSGSYWYCRFYTYEAGKQYLNPNELFKNLSECLIYKNINSASLLRMINILIENDLNIEKEIKIKYYQLIFEKYYVQLSEDPTSEHYKQIKQCLSKLALKLKALGIDVK